MRRHDFDKSKIHVNSLNSHPRKRREQEIMNQESCHETTRRFRIPSCDDEIRNQQTNQSNTQVTQNGLRIAPP
jgi:hypothetical protein